MSLSCIPGVKKIHTLAGGNAPDGITFQVSTGSLPAQINIGAQQQIDKTTGGVLASQKYVLFEIGPTTGSKSQPASFGGPDPARRTSLDFVNRTVTSPGWTIGDNPYGHFSTLFMPKTDVFWQVTGHVRAGDNDLALVTEGNNGEFPSLVMQAEHALCFAVAGRGVGVRIEAGARSTTTSSFPLVLHEMAVTSRAPATVQGILDVTAAGLRIREESIAPSGAGLGGELRFVISGGVASLYGYTGSAWKRTAAFA